MDWNAAIEKNREALKRILSALVAMAGLADGRAGTLPRHLHRAVLRLLRPAEAATRRLVIAAARGIVVAPPPPPSAVPLPRKRGRIQVVPAAPLILPCEAGGEQPVCRRQIHRAGGTMEGQRTPGRCAAAGTRPARDHAERGGGGTAMRRLTLPLFDPLRLPSRRRPVACGVPRISVPGYSAPFSLPPPPSPDDPVNAARLGLRLAALATALDDLPAHARRFARWRARCDAQKGRIAAAPPVAAAPRPAAGWRRRPGHEVDDVLNNAHGLAFWALERPDTS